MNFQTGNYPSITEADFYKILSRKKEFYDSKIDSPNKDIYCLEPQQRFLSNFINPLTQYNSVLAFHSVGVGKTLTAISIAENFKRNYRIIVLIKNKNLELNFRNELIGACSDYVSAEQKIILQDPANELYEETRSNIDKEINKYYNFINYGSLVNSVLGRRQTKLFGEDSGSSKSNRSSKSGKTSRSLKPGGLENINNTLLIVDEVHNVTNNDAYTAIMKLLKNSVNVKTVLLSATPVYDNVKEIFEIANLLGNSFPIRNDLFKYKLIEPIKRQNTLLKGVVNILTKKGEEEIAKSFKGRVSYLDSDQSLFPKKVYKGEKLDNSKDLMVFKSPMSEFQENGYRKYLGSSKDELTDPRNSRKVSDLSPLIVDDNDALFKKASDALTIVYPDGSIGKKGYIKFIQEKKSREFLTFPNIKKYSSKLYDILNNVKNSDGPVFVYSNFVNYGGTSLLKETFLANGYSLFGSSNNKPKIVVLDDSVSSSKKSRIISTYNMENNKKGDVIKIIIGSPVLSEGISFKRVRQIHILEPYWNLSRVEQIIGRGVRLNSHKDLPKEQQKVEIYLYTSMVSSGNSDSIDFLKYFMSYEKNTVITKAHDILKKFAIDCSLNKSRNGNKISCYWDEKIQKSDIDISTYSILHHDKSLYKFILKHIKSLFSTGYIYDLQNIIDYVKNKTKKTILDENIYYVLDDIISKPIELNTPSGVESNMISVGNYYIVNPVDNPRIEILFNKIYNSKEEFKSISEILSTSKETPKIQKQKGVIRAPRIISGSIIGSYLDKVGKRDNKFRIVDNRRGVINEDKRKTVTGKVCLTYSKSELKDIYDFLGIKKSSIPKSKEDYCEYIRQELYNKDKIIS